MTESAEPGVRVTEPCDAPTESAEPGMRAPSAVGPALSETEARVVRLVVAWLVAVLEGEPRKPTLIQEWELLQPLA